jgi:hypothetical protein
MAILWGWASLWLLAQCVLGSTDVASGEAAVGEIASGEAATGEAASFSPGEVGSGDSGSWENEQSSGIEDTPPLPPAAPPSSPPLLWPASPMASELRHDPNETLVSLSLVDHLRAGDLRIVRPSLSLESLRRSSERDIHEHIDDIVSELLPRTWINSDISLPPMARAHAAQALTMICMSDPQAFQASLGRRPGLLRSLVSLIDFAWREAVSGEQHIAHWMAAEASAEALAVLVTNSLANRDELLSLGALEVLCCLVTARDIYGIQTPPSAVMWAIVALQRLAASYCMEDVNGKCSWVWNQGVHLDSSSTITIDGDPVRTMLAQYPSAVEAAVRYACEGPVTRDTPTEWPSLVNLDKREESALVPWAAAELLQTLSTSESSSSALLRHPDTLRCLCALAHSPDPLERSGSSTALRFLLPRTALGTSCVDGALHVALHDEL